MASNIQTYEQIQVFFEEIIDDSLDPTLEQILLNQGKDDLESERMWKYLLKVDTTQVVNPGDTYLTKKTLPSDFFTPLESGIYVGTDVIPYTQFPFEDQQFFQSISHGYFIDLNGGTYGILGQPNPGGTIWFPYQCFTPPLAPLVNGAVQAGTINQPLFPIKFNALIAYYAAQRYFAIDQGPKGAAWDDHWGAYFSALHDSMVRWDFRIAKQAYANRMSGQRINTDSYPNIISGM